MPNTALCSLHSILLAAGPLGATLHVPADFPTIQACIDAAVSGVDECVVAPGTYYETINFLGKAITLRSSGGGMYNVVSSTTITFCTFSGNSAAHFRRGDFNYSGSGGGMFNDRSSPTVTYCTFSQNSATIWRDGRARFQGSGGGIFNFASNPTVTGCTFSGNSAKNFGGAMVNYWASRSTVGDCAFRGNTADYGAGMYNDSATVPSPQPATNDDPITQEGGICNGYPLLSMTNCTFSRNSAAIHGDGMYNLLASGTVTMDDCILWGDGPHEIVSQGVCLPTVNFSDVKGGLAVCGIDGGGNIDLDPMFARSPDPGPDGMWDGVDDDYGDLRLQAGSPCINAGDPAFVPQPGETDLDGHARVLCGRVDMGAYEFGIGDYDCDDAVGLTDFSHWSACATGPQATALAGEPPVAPSCDAFDFDGDGDVDLFDFASFSKAATGAADEP